jgi:hypothetical protein
MIPAMIAPAMSTRASSSLIATALVRLARLSRAGRMPTNSTPCPRAMLAESAVLTSFDTAVCFVVSGFTIAIDHLAGDRHPRCSLS